MLPKLSKDSEAIKTIRSWFESGKLTEKDKHKSVHDAHELFRPYNINTFRARFNEVKKDYIQRKADASDDNIHDDLDRRCSYRESVPNKKRKIDDAGLDDDDNDIDDDILVGGEELISDGLSFRPLYLSSSWKEPGTMTKRLSYAIVLPSGVSVGDFSVRVVDSGEYLELTVAWPSPLFRVEIMHKKWLSDGSNEFQLYHPKVVGFEHSLRQLRDRSSDKIESTARIHLPFTVQARIERKYNLAWRGSNIRMLYIDLIAAVDDYALVNDDKDFEIL